MILLLDTSTPTCKLILVSDSAEFNYQWEAGRSLADGLLDYIKSCLKEHNKNLHDLLGIGVLKGPGSFTGLRIGITVCNTLADSLNVPIVGIVGESWQTEANRRLANKENDKLVLPIYGREANITKPRK